MALVFAACDNSTTDDNGGNGNGGNGGTGPIVQDVVEVLAIEKLTEPDIIAADVYEGMPVDITGMTVRARIARNGVEEFVNFTDSADFIVSPQYYEAGVTTYTARLVKYFNDSVNVNTGNLIQLTYKTPIEIEQVHYTSGLTKKAFYADDLPNLEGVVLEFDYVNSLVHKQLVIPKDYKFWRFATLSEVQSGVTGGAAGEYFLLIGVPGADPDDTQKTTKIPLDMIYYAQTLTIDEATLPAGGITVDATTATKANAFVAAGNDEAWLNLFKNKGVKVTVGYRGTTETKSFALEDLLTMRTAGRSDYVSDGDDQIVKATVPATVPALIAARPAPEVKLSYRGVESATGIPLVVYSILDRVTVASKDGNTIDINLAKNNPPDWLGGEYDPDFIKGKIAVTAVYRTASRTGASSGTKEVVLADADYSFATTGLTGSLEDFVGTYDGEDASLLGSLTRDGPKNVSVVFDPLDTSHLPNDGDLNPAMSPSPLAGKGYYAKTGRVSINFINVPAKP